MDPFPLWTDAATFDGRPWRGAVDLLIGGFPCQSSSVAGKREGIHDERWIWPHIADVLHEMEPPYALFENVPGLLTVTAAKATTKSSRIWPRWGMTHGTVCSELPPWEPPTDESAGSSSRETEGWSTPRVAAIRASSRSLIGNRQWSAPSLEQMSELQHGLVPREYGSEQQLTPQARRIYDSAMALCHLLSYPSDLWPTATVMDSEGSRNRTANRTNLEGYKSLGMTMNDAIRIWSGEGLWASPRASDGEKGGPNMRGSKGDMMLPSQAAQMVEGLWPTPYGMANLDSSGKLGLGGEFAKAVTQWTEGEWPTPATRDWRSGEASPEMYERNARPLNEMVISWFEHLTHLLEDEGTRATPSAAVVNDGEGVSTWRARQASLKQNSYNGNGAGVPLTIQVQEQCLSSHPDLEAFVGWLSRITGPTSSRPSPPTDGSPNPAPSTPSSSRGSALVRLNPKFPMWLMGGISMVDLGHTCRTAPAPGRISFAELATA